MNDLLLRAFQGLDEGNVRWCLMRDYEQLEALGDGRDVDLLVDRDQLATTGRILRRLGFAHLPARGHAPHSFFVAYDEDSDLWLELDVVTEVACGRPIYALRTGLAAGCLRDRHRRDAAWVPSPEDELVMLLLHCVLDKRAFTPARRARFRALVEEVTREQHLTGLLASHWGPGMSWPQLVARIESGSWDDLLGQRAAVARVLAGRDRLATLGRQLRDRLLRHGDRWARVLRPRALSVALLAPDGAGKTTLARKIEQSFYFPARTVYMGPYRAGPNASARHLPVLGLLGRVVRQWGRYLAARYHRARGRLVIFDRYGYDALAPPRPHHTRLARAHAWVMSHACPAPDLVCMLDAPGEVLHARKGEGSAALLEAQREGYHALLPRLPQMVVVDATPDAEQVRRTVVSLIWRGYAEAFNKAADGTDAGPERSLTP